MRRFRILQSIGLVATAALLASCGSSESGDEKKGAASSGEPARQIATDETPFRSLLEEAGYTVVDARRFPAQLSGRNTSVVTYRSKKKDDVGGVLYSNRRGSVDRVIWHWHFDDVAPDSVTALELNDDGLWDVRIHMKNGKTRDYVQKSDFSFIAPGRADLLAMNGDASATDDLWHVFDGDTTSVWRSSASGRGAWIELATPFGVADGVLTVQLSATEQPTRCEVAADGKKVQEIELSESLLEQVFSLNESARGATTVRVLFKAPRGGGDSVSISELGLK